MYLTVFNKLAVQVNTFFIYIEEEIFFFTSKLWIWNLKRDHLNKVSGAHVLQHILLFPYQKPPFPEVFTLAYNNIEEWWRVSPALCHQCVDTVSCGDTVQNQIILSRDGDESNINRFYFSHRYQTIWTITTK